MKVKDLIKLFQNEINGIESQLESIANNPEAKQKAWEDWVSENITEGCQPKDGPEDAFYQGNLNAIKQIKAMLDKAAKELNIK